MIRRMLPVLVAVLPVGAQVAQRDWCAAQVQHRALRREPLVAKSNLGTIAVTALSAEKIVGQTDVKGGLAVCIGSDNPELLIKLHANQRFVVHGLDTDRHDVDETRRTIRNLPRAILDGKVSVDLFDGINLPYADQVVNLLVVKRDTSRVSGAEMARVLAPRGVVLIQGFLEPHPVSLDRQSRPDLQGWSVYQKRVPTGIDSWSHYLHGPDGNEVAKDTVVGPPHHLRWSAKPDWNREHRYGNRFAMVSAGGRVFYVSDEVECSIDLLPDRPHLVARDAFSGVLLWKLPIRPQGLINRLDVPDDPEKFVLWEPDFPMELKGVATKDQLFLAFGRKGNVLVLDAASGRIQRSIEGTERTEEILISHNTLLTVAERKEREKWRYSSTRLNDLIRAKPRAQIVKTLDLETGEKLWEYDTGEDGGLLFSPVIKGNRVYLAVGNQLMASDLSSGERTWKVELGKEREYTSTIYVKGPAIYDHLIATDRVVLLVYSSAKSKSDTRITAFSAADGHVLWTFSGSSPNRSGTNAFVVGNNVWVHGQMDRNKIKPLLALDIETGRVRKTLDTEKIFAVGHHHRCYGNRATSRFLLTGRRGVEFTQFDTGDITLHHWLRGKCRFGVLPTNGLLYTTPHACSCYTFSTLKGYSALAASAATDGDQPNAAVRLDKGPAFGKLSGLPVWHSADIWPMHRHDARRSGSTPAKVACRKMKVVWKKELGGTLTAATVAGKQLFVANSQTHDVYSLSVNDGRILWRFPVGARVDSPPTLFEGLALFGSADGYVYCLRADTGELVWRFLAAQRDHRIIANDQLESVWPVHGSVLVQKGIAYFSAGRISLLDGGIAVYAVQPATGTVIAENVLFDSYADAEPDMLGNTGHGYEGEIGVLQDVLTGDGQNIALRQRKLDGRCRPVGKNEGLISGNGLLNPAWFSRLGWYFGIPHESRKSNADVTKFRFLDSPRQGQYLVFDDATTYSVRMFPIVGKFNKYYAPGDKGYRVFADDNQSGQNKWNIVVPVRVEAMLASAQQTLFLAGSPDVVDRSAPWSAIDGKKGGRLLAVSAATGETLSELTLDSPPVFDGISTAGGELFVSLKNGSIICCAIENNSSPDSANNTLCAPVSHSRKLP